MTIEQLWNARYETSLAMPREIKFDGFCRWLPRNVSEISSIEDLEGLDLPLVMGGGSVRFPGSSIQDVECAWRVVGEHPNLRLGEIFMAVGANMFEASIGALMTVYEMITMRKTR